VVVATAAAVAEEEKQQQQSDDDDDDMPLIELHSETFLLFSSFGGLAARYYSGFST
jgi:hypothetical protein